MKRYMAALALTLSAAAVQAQPVFSGTDYSGIYDCTGVDAHEGAYTGIVTMTLDPDQSEGAHGAYRFKLEVPGFGTYLGQAVSHGASIAMYFALTDQSAGDYGTGLAIVEKSEDGRVRFHKFYYEPEYAGGNHGTEDCLSRN